MECQSIRFPCQCIRFPCQCIQHLLVSSLRTAFEKTCLFLNQSGWEALFHHFESQEMLANEDIVAIMCTSRLSVPTQTKEMLLRLEQKMQRDQNMDFTIKVFLRHAYTVLPYSDYFVISEIFVNLHNPQCPILATGLPNPMNFPYARSILPTPFQEAQDVVGVVPHNPLSVSGPTSMNNLSDPYTPYLHITKHPVDTSLSMRDDLVLRCLAESDENISYAWMKDGKVIPGMIDKVLLLQDFCSKDAGDYMCVVTTNHHRVSSRSAKVTLQEDETDNSFYFATEKFALLIANERYSHNPRLSSASNDVNALAETLRDKLHYKTLALVNLELNEMKKAVKLFCRQLVDGAYCVTYLAGHGFENDGQCYIVPTDAPDSYDSRHCFSIQELVYDIRKSCNLSLSVFLLDVCRRRNENAVRLSGSDNKIEKAGNFVISFATMEHGMAFEVKGRELGVYVTSLQKYLDKDLTVTRVLELVHKDIHNNFETRGIQQPEFKSNMFEDRKLGDPINPMASPTETSLVQSMWNFLHVPCKPTLFVFESCGVEVELHKQYLFSNILYMKVEIVEKGCTESCSAAIALRKLGRNPRGDITYAESSRTCFEIENLQRLYGNVLYFTLFLQFKLESNENSFYEIWNDAISVSFLKWWNL